jgi:hypothetical protein
MSRQVFDSPNVCVNFDSVNYKIMLDTVHCLKYTEIYDVSVVHDEQIKAGLYGRGM